MKEFNPILYRLHPDDDTRVVSANLVGGGEGWVVQYDVGSMMEPWIMNVVAGLVKWAHPVDYDVTQFSRLKGGEDKPHPYVTDENIGSCEPSPLIQWDKTQSTWHTDVDKVGRYSVQRLGKRQPFAAFLNGKRIAGVPESTSQDVIKRDIERRIIEARRINETVT